MGGWTDKYAGVRGRTDGRTDREINKIKNKVTFMGLYWLPACGNEYK